MPYIQSIDEFDRQHGNFLDMDHGRRLYHDGARAQPDGQSGWMLYEPPAIEHDRLRLQLEYARTVVDQAREDFAQLKAASLGQLGPTGMPVTFTWPTDRYGPAPDAVNKYGHPDPVAALQRLKQIVQEREQSLNAIEDEFRALPQTQEILKRDQYRRREMTRQQNEALRRKNEIQKIVL